MSGYAGAMLDTSVWLALFEGDARVDALRAAQGELPAVTSPVVIAELASLSARGRAVSRRAIDDVLGSSRLEELTADDAVRAGELHDRLRARGHDKVGLGDCLIYATARRVGALLITFDSDLAGEDDVKVLGGRKAKPKG